jgi:hypothetical protein
MYYGVRFSKEARLPPIRACCVFLENARLVSAIRPCSVAHRVKAHRIRYIFRFSEETSELNRFLLELNDFSSFRPILFLCFTNVRFLAR